MRATALAWVAGVLLWATPPCHANTPPPAVLPPILEVKEYRQTIFNVEIPNSEGSFTHEYQWLRDGSAIPGATSPTFTIENTPRTVAGEYSVLFKRSDGLTFTSQVAQLHVAYRPRFTLQPKSFLEASPGDTVTITAEAAGYPEAVFEWLFEGSVMSGMSSSVLTLHNVTHNYEGVYSAKACNSEGCQSSEASVLVLNDPPVFNVQPQPTTVNPGERARLTISISGSPFPTIQWYRNSGVPIAGEVHSTLDIVNVQELNQGAYYAIIENTVATVKSDVVTIYVNDPPSILQQPTAARIDPGSDHDLCFTVVAEPAPFIEWLKDGEVLVGETRTCLSFVNMTRDKAGRYTARAFNSAGRVESQDAEITVTKPPTIKVHPQRSVIADEGGGVELNVIVVTESPETTTYQWYFGDTAIVDALSSTYSFTATLPLEGNYTVAVTNVGGTTVSQQATLSVVKLATLAGADLELVNRTCAKFNDDCNICLNPVTFSPGDCAVCMTPTRGIMCVPGGRHDPAAELHCQTKFEGTLFEASATAADTCQEAVVAGSTGGAKSSVGLIAGIVGGVAGLALVAIIVVMTLVNRRQARRREKDREVQRQLQAELCAHGDSEPNPLYHSVDRFEAQRTARSLVEATYALVDEIPRNGLPQELIPSLIRLEHDLGKGVGGTVYKGSFGVPTGSWEPRDRSMRSSMHSVTSEDGIERFPAAFKLLKPKPTEEERQAFLSEAYLLNQFDHENVIRPLGVVTTSTQLIIVLELAEKGSLLTMLRKHGDISKLQRVRWAIDVSTGMEYLTRLGFIHRDIAARNVLVMADGSCKISDFGFSKETCDNKDYVHVPGRIAFQWAAIEALQDSKYTAKSDVWSFGVLLFELWSKGQKPYGSWDNLRVRSELHDGYRLPPPQRCPLEIYTIMMDCWHPDEHQRPDFYTLTETLKTLSPQTFTTNYNNREIQNKYRGVLALRRGDVSIGGNTSNRSTFASGVGSFLKDRLSRFGAQPTPTPQSRDSTMLNMADLRVYAETDLNISVEHAGRDRPASATDSVYATAADRRPTAESAYATVDRRRIVTSEDPAVARAVPPLDVMSLAESPISKKYAGMRQELFPPSRHSMEIASNGARRGSSLNPGAQVGQDMASGDSGKAGKRVSRGLFPRRSGAYALEAPPDLPTSASEAPAPGAPGEQLYMNTPVKSPPRENPFQDDGEYAVALPSRGQSGSYMTLNSTLRRAMERTDRKWGLDHLTEAASPAVGPALDSSVRSEDINMSLFSMGASPVATEFSRGMPSIRQSVRGRDLPGGGGQPKQPSDRRRSDLNFLTNSPLHEQQENEIDVSQEHFGGGKVESQKRPVLSPSTNNTSRH